MAVKSLLYFGVGLVLITLGRRTWKTGTITFLSEYRYRNVKDEDMPAYTRALGIGLIVFGAGPCLTGLLQLITQDVLTWTPVVVGFLAGLVILNKAQLKYNGTWLL